MSAGDIVVNMLNWVITVNEFELQPRYYVHFQTNTLGQSMNALIFTDMV